MKTRLLSCIALSAALLGVPSAFAQQTAAKPAPAAIADAETGKAVYYSTKFNGRKTAGGVRFNSNAMMAAHRTLPFGTKVRVTNNANKKSVIVSIVDRGPSQPDRIIDLSRAAAAKLGFIKAGSADVSIKVVGRASGKHAGKHAGKHSG